MLPLYLNQNSISLLTQSILLLASIGYLLTLARKSTATWLFLGMTSGSLITIDLLFLGYSLLPWHPYNQLANAGLWLAALVTLWLAIEFAYQLPRPLPQLHSERLLLRTLSLLSLGGIALLILLSLVVEQAWLLPYTQRWYRLTLSWFLLWTILTHVRRTLLFTRQSGAKTGDTIAQRVTWWQAVWQPKGSEARTTRTMVLVFAIPLCIALLEIPLDFGYKAASILDPLVTFLTMLTFFVAITAYLNCMPEPTSFLAKLVGISLFAVLAMLGQVGWLNPEFTAPSQVGSTLSPEAYLALRQSLHQEMLPLLWLILAATLLIVLGFPLFFRITLIQPLNRLVDGTRQINAGALDVVVPQVYNDEIGFLTQSFNGMVRSIQQSNQALLDLNTSLEERVQERTQQLRHAKEAAEVANQVKTTFLANMSHELRTPLNAILGYAQILQRETHQSEGLAIIEKSGQHLLTLINDLLDLARLEVDTIALHPTSLHLPNFLRQIGDMIRLRTEGKGLIFRCEIADDLPTYVQVDETRLRQVLINLLGNAVKFTDHGHIVLRVNALGAQEKSLESAAGQSRLIRFEVNDTGVGIDGAVQQLIFEPFRQVSEQQKRQDGAGLGLTISWRLVQQMGGRLQVRSEIGQGSTFWFELNLMLPAMPAATSASPRKVIGVQGVAPTILVVDDKWENRRVLIDLLSPLGFAVIEAADGATALRLLQQEQQAALLPVLPSVLIIDLVMPQMDGFALIQQARRLPTCANLPIIAVSASILERDQQRSFAAGCNAFLPKPIVVEHLLTTLQQLLSLTWLYAETPLHPSETSALPSARPTPTAPDYPFPSAVVLQELLEHARRGDIRSLRLQTQQLVQQDPSLQAFVDELMPWLRSYQTVKLSQWLETMLHDHPDHHRSNPE